MLNAINFHLTALNNHHGKVNKEIRLLYVVDQLFKIPMFFRYIAGNIIDNSTLITTFNSLHVYGINVQIVIMDAGYFSTQNIEQLCKNNIPFLVRMPKNRLEYKQLMEEHGSDLFTGNNSLKYGRRTLFGKKIKTNLFGSTLYAYLMLDVKNFSEDIEKSVDNNLHTDKKIKIFKKDFETAGRVML